MRWLSARGARWAVRPAVRPGSPIADLKYLLSLPPTLVTGSNSYPPLPHMYIPYAPPRMTSPPPSLMTGMLQRP